MLKAFGSVIMRLPEGNWSLRVTKEDSGENPITFTEEQMASGSVPAKFSLYSDTREDAKLLEAVCDRETGVCIFSQPTAILSGLTALCLRELAAPTGYAANNQW